MSTGRLVGQSLLGSWNCTQPIYHGSCIQQLIIQLHWGIYLLRIFIQLHWGIYLLLKRYCESN